MKKFSTSLVLVFIVIVNIESAFSDEGGGNATKRWKKVWCDQAHTSYYSVCCADGTGEICVGGQITRECPSSN